MPSTSPAAPVDPVPFTRRLVLGLVLANSLVLALTAWALYQTHSQYQAMAQVTVQNLSLVLDRSIGASIDKIDVALSAAEREIEREMRSNAVSTTAIDDYFNATKKRLPEVSVMRASNAQGVLVWGLEPGQSAQLADRDYFIALRDNPQSGMVISQPVLGRVSDRWMVFLARRLDDAQGKFAGVVYAGIDITYFVKLFSELDVGKNGRVSLRNLDHVVIARTVQPDGQLVGIGSSKITPTFKAILDSKTNAASFMSSGADEIERLFYYRKISRYPLYVTIGLATSDYMSEWREGAVKTIALALLFSLISCAGGALVRHSWKRQEALAALLEQRVLERTAELETANNELRRASAQLIQAEKLSALGSLVAGVSHELNTPIGNMRLTASSLSGRVQDFAEAIKSEGMRRSQLYDFIAYCVGATELIDRAAVRSGELIQSFKQVAVDQTSLRRRRFDLKHTIDQTVLTLTPLLKRTNFSLQVDIPDGIEMEGYPGPLEQVLTNFVTNSLAHAFTGRSQGQMLIRARQISEGEIELEYRDDGLGIPADIVARVFDPFFTTKFGHGGSGLGLYTVYNIVSGILGGVIELDGRPGQGARFIVRIPLTSPQQSGAEEMAL